MRPRTVRFFYLASLILFISVAGSRVLTYLGARKSEVMLLESIKDSSDIAEIILQKPSERIVLKRVGSLWKLTEIGEALADPGVVRDMVDALFQARVEEKVSARKERASDFDLDDSHAIKLSAKDLSGVTLIQGRLGKQVTGSFDRSYFAFEGSNEIYIVKLARYKLDQTSSALKAPEKKKKVPDLKKSVKDVAPKKNLRKRKKR